MKFTFFALLSSLIIFMFAVIIGGESDSITKNNSIGAPKVENGRQIIEIRAKGGYTPGETVAQANIPSLIRIKTQATFDCSASLLIPALGFRTFLPSSGVTDVPVPAQKPGTTLTATCGMGMYSFRIQFN